MSDPSNLKKPPHSVEFEQAVIGAVMAFPDCYDEVSFLHPDDFFRHDHRVLWEHIKQSIMPVMVLALFQGASWTRYVRSAVLDVLREYIRTRRQVAAADGTDREVGRRWGLYRSTVRNWRRAV